MSYGAVSSCSKTPRLSSSSEQRPLRSVENQLDLTSPHHGLGVGGAGHHRHSPKMDEDTFHNNNITISTKVCMEPFTDHYTVEETIGRGKFAVVKRCRRHQNNKMYAAKFLRKRRKGKDCRLEILHEISMLEMARLHPRLVDLVEVFETSHELILITEYAQGGELYQQVVLEERIEEREVKRLMRQILEGLVFLHDRNTVHLDVKPQNILLTNRLPYGDIKLCDFGFARKVYSGEDVRDIIGTPDYVAPEVLSYDPIHTASDMWSVGVLAYVMLTGYSPFAADTKQETFLNISQVNIDFPEDLFEDISSAAQEFMMKLLVRNPADRLVARDCLNHPWLQTDEPSVPIKTSRSPFGSPIGYRRALTPPALDGALEEEPLKKCKCDEDSPSSEDEKLENGQMSDDGPAVDENNPKVTPRGQGHVTVKTTTPRILEERNKLQKTDISSPSSSSARPTSSPAKVFTTTAHVEIGGVTPEQSRTSDRGKESKQELTYTPDKNCLAQVDVEKEIFC